MMVRGNETKNIEAIKDGTTKSNSSPNEKTLDVHQEAPIHYNDCISSCLSNNSNYHRYQTRTQSDLSVIRFNRTASQSSFIYQGTIV